MGFLKKIINAILPNGMEDNVNVVGEEPLTLINDDDDSSDWSEKLPNLISPSLINLRMCYNKSSIVKGVIDDLVIKSISGWNIEADSEEIKKYLLDEFKRLDLTSLMRENATNNLVDGAMYYNQVIRDGKLYLRELAYDGVNYRILEVKDPVTGEVIGYKQKVLKNQNTNTDWMKNKFEELEVKDNEEVEINLQSDEVIATHFLTRYGVYNGIVENVLDDAYMYDLLKRMLPQIVYKQSNILIIQKDMNTATNKTGVMARIKNVLMNLSNPHTKGAVHVPSDFTVDMIGGTVLPDVPSYLQVLKENIYVGLSTPPAVFEGSSSNRSTAVVQLDSKSSGRVLLQQYIQMEEADFVQKIIDELLLLGGYNNDSACIVFEDKSHVQEKEDQDEPIVDENDNVSTSKPGDGLNLDNISNGEGRLNEVSA